MNEKIKSFFSGLIVGILSGLCLLGRFLFNNRNRNNSDSDRLGNVEAINTEHERELQSAEAGIRDAEQILSEVKKRKLNN